MPRTLYDLLPEDVKAAHPPQSLDAPAAAVLLKPGRVPDDYDPDRAAELGDMLAGIIPRMTGMRTLTNRVRAGQRGELGPVPEAPSPAVQSATQRIYDVLGKSGGVSVPLPTGQAFTIPGKGIQLGARATAAAVQAAPKLPGNYTTRDLVPAAKDAAEHIADLAGGTAGFMATAGTLGAIPGVGPALAAGATGALQEGTPKERAIRAVTLATGAGLAGKAAGAIAGEAPGVARAVASHVPGAAAFGAAVPWADAFLHRITGEKQHPLPGGWESAKGTAEMLAVNLLLGGHGIATAARGAETPATGPVPAGSVSAPSPAEAAAEHPLAPAPPGSLPPKAAPETPPAVQQRAQAIARAVAPPPGLTPKDVAAGRVLTDRLNDVLAGKMVGLRIPGEPNPVAARVERVIAYRPADGERVHLIVTDPSGSPVPVSFGSVDEMVAAVGPLPGNRKAPARVESKETVGAVRATPANARLEAVEGKLARLTANEPSKGAKGYRRWAQRVERLTAERDQLRGSGARIAPRPALVAQNAADVSAPDRSAASVPPNPDADLDLFSERPKAAVPEPRRAPDWVIDEAHEAAVRNADFVVADQRKGHVGPMEGYGTIAASKNSRARRKATDAGPNDFVVDYILVPDDLRRQGVATSLYERAAAQAQARGGRLFSSDDITEAAKAVWEKLVAAGKAERTKSGGYAMKVGGGGTTQAASERASGTAAPIPTPEPEAKPAPAPKRAKPKPLEQESLAGMPKPRIPEGTKKGDDSGTAAALKGFAEPEPERQESLFAPKAEERVGVGSGVSPNTRFKGGEKVRVPNETNRRNDKRDTVTGEVVGHDTVRGEPGVIVHVNRGKSVTQHTVPERLVRKLPTVESRKAALEGRRKASGKLTASIDERIGGSAAKATALAREFDAKADEAQRIMGSSKGPGDPAYVKARKAYSTAVEAANRARAAREQILRPSGSFEPGAERPKETGGRLAPEVAAAHADAPDALAWTKPLAEAAEDHPEAFTPERQQAILRRAQRGELANAVEHHLAIEHERALVEAGVTPEHAAAAVDATDRIRRFIHHERDNPLYEPAEAEEAVRPFEDMLSAESVGTPEALKRTLAAFDAKVPPSPADDVPVGVNPLAGNERGYLALPEGVKTLHDYLSMLREVPKKFAAAVRAIPRGERPRVTDQHGNVVRRFPDLFVYDRFSEHAHARFLSAFAGGRFARIHDILTVPQRLAFKAITPSAVAWHGRLTEGWQKALAGRALDAHSGLSARLSAVMNGEANTGGLPRDYRDLPEKLERNYQDMRMRRNAEAALYGVDPIYSFGVRKVQYPTTPVEGEVQWRVQKERDGKEIKLLGSSGPGGLKVVGETPKGELLVNTKVGEEPLTRYGGPHIVLGQTADAVVPMLEAVLGEPLNGEQRIELRDRFAGFRVGSESKVADAVLQFELYRDMNTRFLSMLPFLHRIRTDLAQMRGPGGDGWRAGLTEAWLRAKLFPQRGGFDRLVDGAFRQILYSQRPFAGHSIGREAAQKWAEELGASLPPWADGYFSVPEDATIKEKPERLAIIGENRFGDRLVAARGRGPMDLRAPERRWLPQAWDTIKAASWAKVAKMANALPEGMSQADFNRLLLRKYRYEAERRYARPADAFYRAIGMNTLRAYIGMNPLSLVKNFLQPALTLAPDAGYRTTAASMLSGLTGRGGVRAAERMGTLQGEVRRLQRAGHETRDRFGPVARLLMSVGPLAPYRITEDYTRGVAFIAAEAMARRLGIPMKAALNEHEVGSKDYYENQAKIAEAIRGGGSGEALAALLDSQAMYDYDSLARPPIFGSGSGRLFGTLSNFSWNAVSELGLRPMSGAAKVAKATARGVLDRVTGGAVGKPKASARVGEGEHTFVRRSGETGAPINQWLREYGAGEHAQRHATMWLKQTIAAGVVLAATAATGTNFALAGTPGHEIITLYALRFLLGKDKRIDAALAAALREAQRSATWNPERGAPMGPIADAIVKGLQGAPDPADVVRGQLPMKAALVRYFQNRQDAKRLRQGGDLYWLAQVLGIRSVTPSRSAGEEVQRNLGLQSRAKMGEHRQNTKQAKPAKRRPSSRIIGDLVAPRRAQASA